MTPIETRSPSISKVSALTDADGDGFSEYEEEGVDSLRTDYMVGDTLGGTRPDALPAIDLNFLSLLTGQTLSVTGLAQGCHSTRPPG